MRRAETSIQVDGAQITLEDLRWLVEQCKFLDATSIVSVKHTTDQRDGDYSFIKVAGAPVPGKPAFPGHGGTCR